MSDKLPTNLEEWLNSDASKGSTLMRPHSELAPATCSATLCRTGDRCVLVRLGDTERHLSPLEARQFAKLILDVATAAMTCTKCGREINPHTDAYQEYENNGQVWGHHLVCPPNNGGEPIGARKQKP